MPKTKKKAPPVPGFPPLIVVLERETKAGEVETCYPHAQIKERAAGGSVYRYLSYRDGSTVKNLYLGSAKR